MVSITEHSTKILKYNFWRVAEGTVDDKLFYFTDHGGRANAHEAAYRYAQELERKQNMQVRDKTEECIQRQKSPAHNLLLEAADIVDTSRRDSYGSPERSFEKIAAYWSVYLSFPVTAADVGRMMELLKIARGNGKDDCLDSAGYAACTWEVSQADPFEDVNIGGTG